MEITEYECPQDYDKYLQTIFRFLTQGYLLALDDFGAGCLIYKTLLEVIPHFVKLDKFFIRILETGDVIVEKIILHLKELCDDLNVYLIAEGIETGEILDKAKSLGIKYGQGYYLGKPSKELNLQE